MKVLLYFEGESLISSSGIGRAMKHQQQALDCVGIEWTCDPNDDYDILHINTFGPNSLYMIKHARDMGRKVIYHAHSTEEDFRNSFVFSNAIAPMFKKHLVNVYSQADYIITPTVYSKRLLEGYGISQPIEAISNGIDLQRFVYDSEKVKAFRRYFSLNKQDKVVLCVGLFFERKGILDFVEVAKCLPEYKFIWFGAIHSLMIPTQIREIIQGKHPSNVIFPGYVKGSILEGAFSGSDVFFFPSYEETEGIVVLEALASHQNVIVRDIGVYDGWLVDGINCYKGKCNADFIKLICGVVEKDFPSLKEEGYKIAEQRSLAVVGEQLKDVYEKVMQL